ncbi:hypothetical protein U1Q18_011611 [Sarracenia purpurea var. burkii]
MGKKIRNLIWTISVRLRIDFMEGFFQKEEIGGEAVRRRATIGHWICLGPARFGGTDRRLQVHATAWSCRGFGSDADRKAKSGVALFLI